MKNKLILSVLIISMDRLERTKSCINSIYENTEVSFEIIVFENGSNDPEINKYLNEMVLNKSNFKVIFNEKNIGCGPGRKVLTEKAIGEYLLMLDNDMEVSGNWFNKLKEVLQTADVIAVSPLVYEHYIGKTRKAGSIKKINSAGFVDLISIYGNLILDDIKNLENKEVDFLLGGAMLFNRKALSFCGFREKDFFFGLDDYDFCNQLKSKGDKLVGVPSVIFTHYSGEHKSISETEYDKTKWSYEQLIRSVHVHYNYWGENFACSFYIPKILIGKDKPETDEEIKLINDLIIDKYQSKKKIREKLLKQGIKKEKERIHYDKILDSIIEIIKNLIVIEKKKAIEHFLKFVNKNIMLFSIYRTYNLASELEKKNYPDEAKMIFLNILDSVLKDKKKNFFIAGIYFHLGMIHKNEGEFKIAIELLKNVLLYNPNHMKAIEVLNNLSGNFQL